MRQYSNMDLAVIEYKVLLHSYILNTFSLGQTRQNMLSPSSCWYRSSPHDILMQEYKRVHIPIIDYWFRALGVSCILESILWKTNTAPSKKL